MIPRIAIIDENTLEAMGLKSILSDIIPMADVCVFPTMTDMQEDADMPFIHYFISAQVLLANAGYFLQRQRQTIVLTTLPTTNPQLNQFHTLNTGQMEHGLVKSILRLHQVGHGNHDGRTYHHGNLPDAQVFGPKIDISNREAEVLALVVKGFINKEIAEKLCISLPTVISHRKNICEKLHIRTVSALTIYAVTHGIVSMDEI